MPSGEVGNDVLYGHDGNDLLKGAGGNDHFFTGGDSSSPACMDTLDGGSGSGTDTKDSYDLIDLLISNRGLVGNGSGIGRPVLAKMGLIGTISAPRIL